MIDCLLVTVDAARQSATQPAPAAKLARQVGLFDATMLVMGGIVGSGIFMNPYVVAQRVHTPALIVGAWVAGGAIALLGAFIYAELAARRPEVGGQYAYLREALHPIFGFLYGWVLLLVIETGGMAAVTVTFARYLAELTGWRADERIIVALTLAVLTVINCLGVKLGSRVQSILMVAKIGAIAVLVGAGFWAARQPESFLHPVLDRPLGGGLLTGFGAAMVPVLFAYGGWQTANFVGGEIKEPRRNLSRALLIGVAGVVALYISVNVVDVRVLGSAGLAASRAPASDLMRHVLGSAGARFIALGIAISTVGFLSQSILTAPRVYFAMAEDGLFFRALGQVSPRTRVPVAAIVLQSVWTAVIAFSGRFDQILNYVVSMDFLFFGLTATCVFAFRRRGGDAGYRVPGHPWTTLLFIAACWSVVGNTIYRYPANSLLGMGILALGVPVYLFWSRRKRQESASR